MQFNHSLQTHGQKILRLDGLSEDGGNSLPHIVLSECLARGEGDTTARRIMEYIGDDPSLHLELTRRILMDIFNTGTSHSQSFSFNAGNELLQSEKFWKLLRSLKRQMKDFLPQISLEVLETTSPDVFEQSLLRGKFHSIPFILDDFLPQAYQCSLKEKGSCYNLRKNYSTTIMSIVKSVMERVRKKEPKICPGAIKLDGYSLFRPTDPRTNSPWETHEREQFVFQYIKAFIEETREIDQLSRYHTGHPLMLIVEGVEDPTTLRTIRGSIRIYNSGLPVKDSISENMMAIQGHVFGGIATPLSTQVHH